MFLLPATSFNTCRSSNCSIHRGGMESADMLDMLSPWAIKKKAKAKSSTADPAEAIVRKRAKLAQAISGSKRSLPETAGDGAPAGGHDDREPEWHAQPAADRRALEQARDALLAEHVRAGRPVGRVGRKVR